MSLCVQPKRGGGVDLNSSTSRDEAGNGRDGTQQHGNKDEREGVGRSNTPKLRFNELAQRERTDEAADHPDTYQTHGTPSDECKDLSARSAERDADGDLTSSLRNRIGHDAVNTDARQQRRDD